MDAYQSLLDLANLLLSADDTDRTASALVRRLVETCGADRGFVVVREHGSYEQKADVHYDRDRIPDAERRFSRSLVRRAIETGEAIVSDDLTLDSRFRDADSVAYVGACSVLVAPLTAGSELYGVLYLDRKRPAAFEPEMVEFVKSFAALAGQLLRRALQREELDLRRQDLERDLFAKHDFRGIVTRDPAMLGVLEMVAQVAATDATVLVHGETGTGKELIAHAVHVNSPRRARPMVALHCTALPPTLLESELFGHVRGAFTGADRDRSGRIASAHGGTLFLDELGEIPHELQAKLLRFMQFGEMQRLGSDRVEKVDVRVVAATHRDLRAEVEAGRFRRDLYFRLKVVEVGLPPLRARRGDVPLLLEAFLLDKWKRPEEPHPRFSDHALSLLEAYDWPGNVRELQHVVERACVLAKSAELGVELLPPEVLGALPEQVQVPAVSESPKPAAAPRSSPGARFTAEALERARSEAVAQAEREFLDGLMQQAGGNVSQAARDAGMHRSYLQRLLAKHRPKS